MDIFRRLTKGIKLDKTKFQKEFLKLGHNIPVSSPAQSTKINSAGEENDTEEDDSEEDVDEISLEGSSNIPSHHGDSTGDPASNDSAKKKPKKNSKTKAREAVQQHVVQMKALRKQNNISAKGSDIPDIITEFGQLHSEYGVSKTVLTNILEQNYTDPTPIQMQCWPIMLRGREILATAPTGSGKTAAFLVPVIHQLVRPRALGFRAMIVSPTRELAEQTMRECTFLCKGTGLKVHLIDKVDKVVKKFGPGSSQKFDILITTPNRLVYLLKEDKPMINLDNVEWLIVDECDRLFEGGKRGFRDQLASIYQACSGPKVRRAFFSATLSNELLEWSQTALDNIISVRVGLRNTASEDVEQELVFCGDESGKIHALREIFRKGYEPPCLVFVQSKERARQLFKELVYDNVMVDAIHSDRTQKQREACVQAFRAKKIWVLICTELMSRGIDFKGVNLVINYDFPPNLVSYIHRIGRTGRAQRKGRAITFWTVADQSQVGIIARTIRASGSEVPEWLTGLKRPSHASRLAAKSQKNRGFVSEGAKFTKAQQEERKMAGIKHKLKLAREGDDNQKTKAHLLKLKLKKIESERKVRKNNELVVLEGKEKLKQRTLKKRSPTEETELVKGKENRKQMNQKKRGSTEVSGPPKKKRKSK